MTKKRDIVYVTNFDRFDAPGQQFISKVSLDGKVQQLKWVENMFLPTGMAIFKVISYLWSSRRNVAEVDLETGKEASAGKEGELYVRGPQIMKGCGVSLVMPASFSIAELTTAPWRVSSRSIAGRSLTRESSHSLLARPFGNNLVDHFSPIIYGAFGFFSGTRQLLQLSCFLLKLSRKKQSAALFLNGMGTIP
jgi:hypothetical protein